MKDKEKDSQLKALITGIEKQFGKGSIMKLGKGGSVQAAPSISTGSIGLDNTLGIGGFPCGRMVEIFGEESSGKTTLALQAIASVQKAGGTAVFIDAEHALDLNYAKKLGVDIESLYLSQPSCAEQALDISEELINSKIIDIIVIDSVAALVPRAEIEGDAGDSHMGLQARLMSQMCRKTIGPISRTGTLVVFINQLRSKLAVTYGSNKVTCGGNALKFYTSVRCEISRIAKITQHEQVIGGRTRVRVIKNKFASPFQEVEFDLIYGQGINRAGEIIDLGCEHGIIEKKGAWFAYNGENLAQGRDNACEALKENPERMAEIEAKVRTAITPTQISASDETPLIELSGGEGE